MRRLLAAALVMLFVFQASLAGVRLASAATYAPTYVREDSRFIYIGNQFIELQFDKTSYGGIYSIINEETGDDYVTLKQAASTLFSFSAGAPADVSLSSDQATSFAYNYTSTPNLSILQISSGFQGGYDANTVVTIRVYSNSSLTRWDFAMQNLGGAPIDNIVFPQINGPQRMGVTTSDNYILVPDDFGSMLMDPYDSMLANSTSPGCMGSGDYPSFGGVMQMLVYGDAAGGLYLATYDSSGGVKNFGACKSYIGNPPTPYLSVFIDHKFPETPETNVTIPYDTIVGAFAGDWHSAGDIYRSWALTQWWTAQGPLYQQSDVPSWFEGGYVVLNVNSYGGTSDYTNPDQYVTFQEIPTLVSSYLNGTNSPLVFQWWGWEQYGSWANPNVFPPHDGWAAFKQTIDTLHSMGVHVIISLGAGNIDYQEPGFNSTLLSCAIRNSDGSLYSVDDMGRAVAWASPACTSYQNLLINQTATLEKMGVDGVRLDGMFLDPYDYSSVGGHPPGYGNWYAEDLIQFYERLVNATRTINPSFLLGNEHLPELFIPFNQIFESDAGIVGSDSSVQAWGSEVRHTGLFYYVYNDYVSGFSRELHVVPGANTYPDYQEYLLLAQALGLTFGETINFADTSQYQHAPASSLSDSLAWASSFAGPYTDFGRDLRPPNMTVPATHIDLGLCCSNPTLQLVNYSTPQVMTGAWQAPDTSVGLLFINLGDTSIQIDIPVGYYESLVNSTALDLVAMNEDTFQVTAASGSASLTIPPQKAVTLLVVPAGKVGDVRVRYYAFRASYIDSGVISTAAAAGLDVSSEQQTLAQARSSYESGDYAASQSLAMAAINATVHAFDRFGYALPQENVYSAAVSSMDEALRSSDLSGFLDDANATVNVAIGRLSASGANILFDWGHSNQATLLPNVALGISPDAPENVLFTNFTRYLTSLGYNVTSNTVGLTSALLSKYQILILCSPTSVFQPSEVTAIENFVSGGGGLFFMAANWTPLPGNSVTSEFGVTITADYIQSPEAGDPQMANFGVSNISSSPVTAGVPFMPVNIAAPMAVAPDSRATVVAWTPDDTYSGSQKGPFPFVISEEHGAGRVVIFADNFFENPIFPSPEKMTLTRNIVGWLRNPLSRTLLVESVPPSYHVGVGSELVLPFRLLNASSGAPPVGTTVTIGSGLALVASSGWANVTLTSGTVGVTANSVASASDQVGALRVLYSVGDHNTTVIWDRVDITLSSSASKLTPGTNATITWTAYYEYDHSPFIGTLALNDTTLKTHGGTFGYTVGDITDDKYGLTAFDSNSLAVEFTTQSTTGYIFVALAILIVVILLISFVYKSRRRRKVSLRG